MPENETVVLDASGTTCGIIMPISSIDGCSESHWSDVLEILSESISDSGFTPNIVSNADDVGLIHKRIIQNLYDNPVVVCDVSGKNPNVMFELGMRLAFDKPTIIVKDDKTSYSFDTSAIEHIEYPRDLRFARIVEFKRNLSEKIKATHEKSKTDKNYTTFLKHFGEFTVAKIKEKEVSAQEFIVEEMREIRNMVGSLHRQQRIHDGYRGKRPPINICMQGESQTSVDKAIRHLETLKGIINIRVEARGENHQHIVADALPGYEFDNLVFRKQFQSRRSRRISESE